MNARRHRSWTWLIVGVLGGVSLTGCGDGKADPKVRGACVLELNDTNVFTREETFRETCRNDISVDTCDAEAYDTASSRRTTMFTANTTCADIGYTLPCGTLGFVQQASDC